MYIHELLNIFVHKMTKLHRQRPNFSNSTNQFNHPLLPLNSFPSIQISYKSLKYELSRKGNVRNFCIIYYSFFIALCSFINKFHW